MSQFHENLHAHLAILGIVFAFGLLTIGGGVTLTYYGAAIFGIFPMAVVVGWMILLRIQQAIQ